MTKDSPAKRSVLDALQHGLPGQTLGISADDRAAYDQHTKKYLDECQPADRTEIYLVQTLAHASWWLRRIFALENNLLNAGIIEEQKKVPAGQPPLSHVHAMTLAYFDHFPVLDKLGRHQERISILFSMSIRQLTKIQTQRRGMEKERMKMAVQDSRQEALAHGNSYRA